MSKNSKPQEALEWRYLNRSGYRTKVEHVVRKDQSNSLRMARNKKGTTMGEAIDAGAQQGYHGGFVFVVEIAEGFPSVEGVAVHTRARITEEL